MPEPIVTLKIATSLDGRIALSNGVSRWITGSDSRARVHRMRARHDAVVSGIGTVLADDPLLTVRHKPLPERQPVRIIADSSLQIPADSRLLASIGAGPVIVASLAGRHTVDDGASWRGAKVWVLPENDDGRVSLPALLARCTKQGLNRIFVEGGGQLAASFIKANLVNTIEWFRAPVLIGGDGLPAIADLSLTVLAAMPRWRLAAIEQIGEDSLETYVRA